MAGLGIKFDPTQHNTESRDFPDLPSGDYVMEVTESEVKPTSNGSGTLAALVAEVIEPEELKGRKMFLNINLENKNAQAQEIGQRELASLCRAAGIDHEIEDTDELHFKRFTCKVGMGKDSKDKNADGSPKYPAKAEIKKYYYPDEGNVPPAKVAPVAANDNRRPAASTARSTGNSGSAPTQQAAAPAASTKPRPWDKPKAA